MPVLSALRSCHVPDLALEPDEAAAIQSLGRFKVASVVPLSAAAQFAGGEILGPDALGERTGLAPSGLAAALTMLELKRAVVKRADGSYEGL